MYFTTVIALQGSRESDEKPNTPNEDPFAASDAIVTPESDLAGKFQKSKDGPTDVIAGLSDLTVPTIPLGMTVSISSLHGLPSAIMWPSFYFTLCQPIH